MIDYHAPQFVPPISACDSRNCAASTGAMDVYFGTRGRVKLTSSEFRSESGVSCIPGNDTPSGGLDVASIERVCARNGVEIDFRGPSGSLKRWTEHEVYTRLSTYYFGHLLGMYSNVPAPWRAKGSTFMGGHSVGAHDVRDDLPDSHYGKVQRTGCWHDPLRARPIRVPWSVIKSFSQSDSQLEGLAGFVRIPVVPEGEYAEPMLDRTRTDYTTVAVHHNRTTGKASTIRVIRGEGTLVEVAMYGDGESYRGSRRWAALSLLGNEWVHTKRIRREGGDT